MPSSARKKFFFNDTATTEIYTLSLHELFRSLLVSGISKIYSPNLEKYIRLAGDAARSEEHTSELQSQFHLVCRLLLVKNFFLMIRRPPRSTLFPYTSSSDLFSSAESRKYIRRTWKSIFV